jgi:hypothetical protein
MADEMMKKVAIKALTVLLLITTSSIALADEEQAREAFRQGAGLARDAQWAAALSAFDRSYKLHPSAGTTFNIGVCERALGQYVRARRTLQRALDEKKTDADLPDAQVQDIKRFLSEIDRLIGTIDVTLSPADALVTVDGAPLEASSSVGGSSSSYLAGTSAAGPGKPVAASSGHFKVDVDPGAHVFVIARAGYADAVKSITVRPGEKTAKLDLNVERLPALLTVSADRPESAVSINALDVGLAPVDLTRPAGKYHVVVRRPGFLPYEVDTKLESGQKTELRAKLEREKPSLLTQWWFWTAAGVVVVGAAVTTYAVTRPDPERPPLDGGSLGWTARAP